MNQGAAHGVLYGGNPPSSIGAEPLIINACLSGNVTTRSINPHVPVTANEIVDNALEVLDAGATMLHVHAYEDDGTSTWRPEVFGKIFAGIRAHAPDAVLVATTSGRLHGDLAKRSAVLDLSGSEKPDMASLTLGSLNFPGQASINAPETLNSLCLRMRERGIVPELEAFDLGMINYAFFLQRKGLLPLNCYINLMLGSLGTVPGRVGDLAQMVRELPASWVWSGAGIGRYQLQINTTALLMGGNVRVGLEDNPYYDYANREPATNRRLVERIVRLATELGRPIASCAETRLRLRLHDGNNWAATRTTIRKMRIDDLHAAIEILRQWNMAPISPNAEIQDPERDHLEIPNSFVAEINGHIVGVSSWLDLGDRRAETASLAVAPGFLGCGIGFLLQQARLDEMRAKGIRSIRTEADRPDVIHWYQAKFGYRLAGQNKKKHAFGLPDRDYWTVLTLEFPDSAN